MEGGKNEGPPPVSHNIVLNSRYSRQTGEGRFVFDVPGETRYAKISLGTIELPPAQLPIEENWSKIFISEGLRISSDIQRLTTDTSAFDVPLASNRVLVSSLTEDETGLRVTFTYPHGMGSSGRMAMAVVRAYESALGVVLTPSGISVQEARSIEVVDDFTLEIKWQGTERARAKIAEQRGASVCYMQTGAISDPYELVSILRALGAPARASDGTCVVESAMQSGLGKVVNVPAYRWCGGVRIPPGSGSLKRVATAYARGLGAIVPALRPRAPPPPGMTYPEDVPLLVMIIGNKQLPVPLNSPRYTLAQLSAYCSACASSVGKDINFNITSGHDGKVSFSSADGQTFGINFGHQTSVDASLFGFRQVVYDGYDNYTGEQNISTCCNTPIHDPHSFRLRHSLTLSDDGTKIEFETNRWRVPLTKGRLPDGTMLPIKEGDLVAYGSSALLHVARGYPKLEIAKDNDNVMSMVLGFEELSEADANIDITLAPDATLSVDTWAQSSGAPQVMKNDMLGIDTGRMVDETQKKRGVLTRGPCIPGPLVQCPRQFSMDHPPYVLLQVSGEGMGSTCQRAVQAQSTYITIFAKVLFAPYRVERQNPAEVMIPGGKKIGSVQFTILNPDGTPYHTHGIPFSISLNTVTLHP